MQLLSSLDVEQLVRFDLTDGACFATAYMLATR